MDTDTFNKPVEPKAGDEIIVTNEYIVDGKSLDVNIEFKSIDGKKFRDLSTDEKVQLITGGNPLPDDIDIESCIRSFPWYVVKAQESVVMYYPVELEQDGKPPLFSLTQLDTTIGYKFRAGLSESLPLGEIIGKIKVKRIEPVVKRPEFDHLHFIFGGNRRYLIKLLQPLIEDHKEIYPTGSYICVTFSKELPKKQTSLTTS